MIAWGRFKDFLKEKTQAADFSFLDVLNLASKLRKAMEALVIYAVEVDLPEIPNLHSSLLSKGYKPWIWNTFEGKGFLFRRGTNDWVLTPALVEALSGDQFKSQDQQEQNQNQNDMQKNYSEGFSKKETKLIRYINRERIGDRFRFTSEQALNAKTEVNSSVNYIWQMLKRLEAKGAFQRVKGKKSEGIILIFNSGEQKAESEVRVPEAAESKKVKPEKPSPKISVKNYLALLLTEIQELEKEIKDLENSIEEKRKTIEEKKQIHQSIKTHLSFLPPDVPEDQKGN